MIDDFSFSLTLEVPTNFYKTYKHRTQSQTDHFEVTTKTNIERLAYRCTFGGLNIMYPTHTANLINTKKLVRSASFVFLYSYIPDYLKQAQYAANWMWSRVIFTWKLTPIAQRVIYMPKPSSSWLYSQPFKNIELSC